MQSEQLPCQGKVCEFLKWLTEIHVHVFLPHLSLSLSLCRLKSSFVVSGSEDCTLKVWRIGRSLVEGEEGEEEREGSQEKEIKKLKVKYTQLAHDKVSYMYT